MSVKERDPVTGYETTGHKWNGITELNTRVPRVIWFFIVVTHVWALIYWVLMPSWPLVNTYSRGLLGIDQQEVVERRVAAANAQRTEWQSKLAELPAAEILNDATLMAHVGRTAPALFMDNCAPCHGSDGSGGPGFPSLVDDAWLWGGDAATIMETLRVGINSPHPESRYAQMLAFGKDGILDREQIRIVAGYVQSQAGIAAGATAERLDEGAAIFAENCASCHGETAEGVQDLGAPNLTDAAWIYGSDDQALFATIHGGRQGWMPAWEGRLSPADRMMLTLYILNILKENGE